jgi:hypothetical protein
MRDDGTDRGFAGLVGADRFVAGLDAWRAAAAGAATIDERRRERWLRVQADEEATFVGVLVDLAEQGRRVAVSTGGGQRHVGAIRVIGRELVVIETEVGATALLRLDAVRSVRSAPGDAGVTGDRSVHLDVTWEDALRVLAEDRPRAVLAAGPDRWAGELRSVGLDVAIVRVEGDGARVYLPVRSIDEVVVAGTGGSPFE